MKNAPCVRLANRIRPKMSEKPDESRNNRPPSDRLLRPWMIQNCIGSRSCFEKCCEVVVPQLMQNLWLQVFCRRVIPGIHGILQECGLVIGPELADIRIGLDDGIDQASIAPCNLANIDVADHIAELIEFDEPAHRLHVVAADRRHQRLLVLRVGVDGLERCFRNLARGVSAGAKTLLRGLSSSAEYQLVVRIPNASSPMLRSTDSSSAVMPPMTAILSLRPYSMNWRKKRNPFEPAVPRKIASALFTWAT